MKLVNIILLAAANSVGNISAGDLTNAGEPPGGTITNGIYYAESYGVSPHHTDVQNMLIFQDLLNRCRTNGGGTVSLLSPGLFPMFPNLAIWPNTTVALGPGTVLRAQGFYAGLPFGGTITNRANGTGHYGGVNFSQYYGASNTTFYGSTAGATNVITVTATNYLGVITNLALYSFYTNGLLEIIPPTNGSGYISGVNQEGAFLPGATNWIPGIYCITNVAGNQLFLNANCCRAAAANLQGAIAFSLFRDALYDACPATNYEVPQAANGAFCSSNITLTGGILDGTLPGEAQGSQWGIEALWFRQCCNLQVRNVVIRHYDGPYACMIEDVKNSIFDNIGFDTSRDGLHMCGPLNEDVVENIHGYCHDNMIAIGAPWDDFNGNYPYDGFPQVMFQHGGAYNCRFINVSSDFGFPPYRISGPPAFYCLNCLIDGLYGWVQSGDCAMQIIDDGNSSGMTISGLAMKNIDIGLSSPATNNSSGGMITINASRCIDFTLDHAIVSGQYPAITVEENGLYSATISNVRMSATNTSRGDNNLVEIKFCAGPGAGGGKLDTAPNLTLSDIVDTTSVTPPPDTDARFLNTIWICEQNGNATVNFNNISLSHGGIYVDGSATGAKLNFNNIKSFNASPAITIGMTNCTTANFNNVYLDVPGYPIVKVIGASPASQTILSGKIEYGGGASGLGSDAVQGNPRVNGLIDCYPGDVYQNAVAGDEIINARDSSFEPWIYVGGGPNYGYYPLTTQSSLVNPAAAIPGHSSGAH